MAGINKDLLKFALNATAGVKAAFVPSDGAANSVAPPPPQPAGPAAGGAGGGSPSPSPQPAPAQPPMDPGMAPGGDPMGGQLDAKIQTAVQSAMQASGGAGGPQGAGMKPPKPDINTVATDVFQLKKMLLHQFRTQGMELPPDILDGPNRDPQNGLPSGAPGQGSDPTGGATQPNAIQGIQPIQPAMLGKGASASITAVELLKEAADVLRLYAVLREHEAAPKDVWAPKVASDVGEPFGAAPVTVSPKNRAAAVCSMFRARK